MESSKSRDSAGDRLSASFNYSFADGTGIGLLNGGYLFSHPGNVQPEAEPVRDGVEEAK
jgi:hypothetical protein